MSGGRKRKVERGKKKEVMGCVLDGEGFGFLMGVSPSPRGMKMALVSPFFE